MSFRQIADRIARIARAATNPGSGNRSERDALREAEQLISAEREKEQAAKRKQEEARRAAARKAEAPKHDPEVVAALRLFGLQPGATLVQVTSEYRRRIVAMHPDRNAADRGEATERTQQLNAAYSLLKRVYRG